jgi:Tol biopolymer transport system component
MAEVYEAEDVRLGRRVAIKFLNAAHRGSPVNLQRFEREARTASSLNSPHICTVYEFGEHGGDPFIVMELLDGQSLEDALKTAPFDIQRLLDVASQIADGLDAAHHAGIIHRDIKPGNIFITSHGDAKILDFGLAKHESDVCELRAHSDSKTRVDGAVLLTVSGTIVGTVPYMSPEQTRGEAMDHRTDLFSFGTVIYEMATGRRPFRGDTVAKVAEAIRDAAPVPAGRHNPDLPPGMQAIIAKALEKDPGLRYQSAADMTCDLQRVRRDIAPVPAPPRPPALRWVWAALIAVGAAALGTGYWWQQRDAMPLFGTKQITSGAGVETDPSLSPDGNTIAFSSDQSGSHDIWIVDASGGPPRPISAETVEERHPSWFPDGRSLAYAREDGGRRSVWVVPVSGGGVARPLIDDALGPAVSPDGRMIAFARRDVGGYSRIAVASVAEPDKARVLTSPRDGFWNHQNPAWSPDGRTICYQASDGLWLVNIEGGSPWLLTRDSKADSEPAWSTDGRFIYFSSFRDGRYALWRVFSAGGVPRRMTVGSGVERSPSVSRDGRTMAFSTVDPDSRHLVLIDISTRRETTIADSSRDEWGPSFASDGKTVYFVSDRWGPATVWSQRLPVAGATEDAVQLTDQQGTATFLECSPDGKWLAYYLIVGARRDIWVVPADGHGRAVMFSDGRRAAVQPSWSPDSRRLAFAAENDGTQQIWVQPIAGGRPAGAAVPVTFSPGAKKWPAWIGESRIAFVTEAKTDKGQFADDLFVVRVDRRDPPRRVTTGANVQRAHSSAALGAILVSGLWGGREYQLRAFDADLRPSGVTPPITLGRGIYAGFFDVSADGRFIVASREKSAIGDIYSLIAEKGRF